MKHHIRTVLKKHNSQHGFSLLEMIVAVGIFSIVAVIAVSAVLALNRVQKKVINIQNTHDNVRFGLESMARDIRTGENYTSSCGWSTGGCSTFSFQRSISLGTVTYRLQTCGNTCGFIERKEGAGPWLPITDPLRSVTKLRFYVTGVGAFVEQERVTIVLEVESGIPTRQAEFANLRLQTSVTKRSVFPSK